MKPETPPIWRSVPNGDALYHRLLDLPGYGDQKARILAMADRLDMMLTTAQTPSQLGQLRLSLYLILAQRER